MISAHNRKNKPKGIYLGLGILRLIVGLIIRKN